jgi:predicted PurR-regulated permease PerM
VAKTKVTSKASFATVSRIRMDTLRAKFQQPKQAEAPLPDASKFDKRQQRILVIAVIAALLAGVYLVGRYFTVIVLSVLAAILFQPLYLRINRKLNRPGTAAMLTFMLMLLVIIIPLVIVVLITIGQVQHLIAQLSHASGSFSVNDAGQRLLDGINNVLASITNGHYQISEGQVHDAFVKAVSGLANFFLNLLTGSFSGIAVFVTQFILFLYIFTSLLTHQQHLLRVFRALNPLGDEISTLYLSRTSQMARGVVGGQFVIAVCQGVVEAFILHLAGLGYFFFFAMILTILSVVPLGGGVVAIPIGIILLLTGNIWQGLLVLLGHFVVITNIDNVLRPQLIPKSIRINSALMMLAVFGGLALFGFLGIAIGPIIMVLVVSTLQIYLPLAESRQRARAAAKD